MSISAPVQRVHDPANNSPCLPSPCGLYSQCEDIGGTPSCSCRDGYTGQPPNCKQKCFSSSECPSNLACIDGECLDPCPETCAVNAACEVTKHIAICSCPGGTGNPFIFCFPKSRKNSFKY